ncbi:MAG: glycosyltransferase, partial [Chloroflexota bacterium]
DVNILPREQLNKLYNIMDLCLVTSRWEGGPHALLESSAAQCKVVSTRVGIADDLLSAACIYDAVPQAVEIITKDITHNTLKPTVDTHYRSIHDHHTPQAAKAAYQQLYHAVSELAAYQASPEAIQPPSPPKSRPPVIVRAIRKVLKPPLTVGLWHEFFEPPYGGGNQFMLALRRGLKQRGIRVVENKIRRDIDVYLLNGIHFDVEAFRKSNRRRRLKIVHRVDGPIHLYRGKDKKLDIENFELNLELASATVIQSRWTLEQIIKMGYDLVRPTIIHNTVDPIYFNPNGRISFDPSRKVKIISTSWSPNVRKGGQTYKWFEDHLDWDRFEYTFVGRSSDPLERATVIPPVHSESVGELLREHDIYFTASRIESCSNALIEALTCGLPALYPGTTSNPELVGYGGVPFDDQTETLTALEELVDHYTMYQNSIYVPSYDTVVDKYLDLLQDVAETQA